MMQIDSKYPSLFEWLSEHETSLEALGETDSRVHTLIDDYIRLMDALEYWGAEPEAQDGAFFKLIRNKELEIMKMISGDVL